MRVAPYPAWQQAVITLSAVATATIVLALLYLASDLLIPIALAIFFTYVLAPIVSFWQRRGLGRTPAVIFTLLGTILALGTVFFLLTRELGRLTDTLAAQAPAIKAKIASVKSTLSRTGDSPLIVLFNDLEQAIVEKPPDAAAVVVDTRRPAWASGFETYAGPATRGLGMAGLAFILLVFMLLSKTDLADRLLCLIGDGRVTVTTQAMADASQRISRYLFCQLVTNVAFGLFIAILLYLIGLDYALLWGLFIGLLRYVPYIGTWLGALPPVLFAFATGDGWGLPLAVAAVIISLELVVNNFLEPRIHGASLGVSDVALLISAALWFYLWGPIGLILSGPITTCLLVVGRHAPPFKFLEILLGNQPPLTPGVAFFQRLASHDQDEALRTFRAALSKEREKPEAVFDEMFLPALSQLKFARAAGQLDADEERRVSLIAREVLDEALEEIAGSPDGSEPFLQHARLLACPAHDEFDRLTLDMLVSRLPFARWEVRSVGVATLTAELLADVAAFEPQVIVIASLPPDGPAHSRYLCKRLRARFPDAHILVGRWGETNLDRNDWTAAGASAADASLADALVHLQSWQPVFEADGTAHLTHGRIPGPVGAR